MIINSKDVCYTIVELTADDIDRIKKGQHVFVQNKSNDGDRDVLVNCYCHNYQEIK